MTYSQLLRHSTTVSIVYIIAYTLVFSVGIVGNSAVVSVYFRVPRMRTVTNLFIANLAVADVLVCLFCVPATLMSNLFVRKYQFWSFVLILEFNLHLVKQKKSFTHFAVYLLFLLFERDLNLQSIRNIYRKNVKTKKSLIVILKIWWFWNEHRFMMSELQNYKLNRRRER